MTGLEDARDRADFQELPGLVVAMKRDEPAALERLADWFFSATRSLARDVVDHRIEPSERDVAKAEMMEALASVPGLQLLTTEGLEDSGDREVLRLAPTPRGPLKVELSLPQLDR